MAFWRAALVALLGVALAACGGGGGGGGGSAPVAETPAAPDYGPSFGGTPLSIERDVADRSTLAQRTVTMSLARPPAGTYWYSFTYTRNALFNVGSSGRTDGGIDFQLSFDASKLTAAGSYEDRVEVDLCADQECRQRAAGGPFAFTVRVAVGAYAPSEPGMQALVTSSVAELEHDFVDAAYSAALDALVVVASRPTPALHVHDLARGTRRSVALLTPGTALALSPSGLQAAVGHDAAVTVVDLVPAAGGGMQTQRLPVGLRVGALLLDGNRRVHHFGSEVFSWNRKGTLELDSGRVTESSHPFVSGIPHLAAHPGGQRYYLANRNVSPSDILVADFGVGADIGTARDSPYHGEHAMCGRVWLSPDGNRLYTASGNTFAASADPALDMRYAGAMTLSGASVNSAIACSSGDQHLAIALSVAPGGARVALLEQPYWNCQATASDPLRCFTRFALYDAGTLQRLQHFSLAPVTTSAGRFAQDGRYLFHRSNGALLMLSELRNSAEPSLRLSVLP